MVEEDMHKIFKIENIDFQTNLNYHDVIEIAEKYIEQKEEPYEINKKSILYEAESHFTHEPVWYVDVISLKVKQRWSEAYEGLVISDREGRLLYVTNDHGRVIEKY